MAFCVIRMAKVKRPAVAKMQEHTEREKEAGREYSNPDIDRGRTADNYHLQKCSAGSHREFIDQRIQGLALKKAVRKDAVVMMQAVITSGPEFFRGMPVERQREFFQDSLEFVKKRYGPENLIAAVVHMDEATPHLHVDFMPVTKDGRLSAKSIFTREELTSLQTDFAEQVGKKWGLERGISREDKRRHLSTELYKLEQREKDIREKKTVLDIKESISDGIKQAINNAKEHSIKKAKEELERIRQEEKKREQEKQAQNEAKKEKDSQEKVRREIIRPRKRSSGWER